jgi:hypothetical protein
MHRPTEFLLENMKLTARLINLGVDEGYCDRTPESRISGTRIYALLNKEKPGIGSLRGLNLAAVSYTTVQLTNAVSEYLSKLMYNLLHKPALTGSLYISSKNVTLYCAVTKDAQSPQ